tara:strand:+ start:5485 stop:7464 length:1980 start_codon:yes stop_codon:yes gene_type:complete
MKDHHIKQTPLQGLEGSGGGLASRLAGAAGVSPKYLDDIFSTSLYQGNGAGEGTVMKTITNGIDLSGEGGLVWIKQRTDSRDHNLQDTERGIASILETNNNNSEIGFTNCVSVFNSDGFSMDGNVQVNANGEDHVAWTFRKCPGFFDIVTYTGDSVNNRTINHNLGSEPGMVIIKRRDSTSDWPVYHIAEKNVREGALNTSYDFTWNAGTWFDHNGMTSTTISVKNQAETNTTGGTYVAYIFAHDDQSFGQYSNQSAIKCGSYTGTGNTNGATIDLGFEPQFLLLKSSSSTTNWVIFDNMRGLSAKGVDAVLYANLDGTEDDTNQNLVKLTSRGFQITSNSVINNVSEDYVYMAIRRPNKPPTAGSQVFDVKDVLMSGTNLIVSTTLQTVDATWNKIRNANGDWMNSDRLHNGYWTRFNQLNAKQYDPSSVKYDYSYQVEPYYWSGNQYHSPYMFKRRPGFFDVVSYIGDGTTSRLVPHNLEAPPEFIIIKRTSTTGDWWVYPNKPGYMMYMNRDNAETTYTAFGTHSSTAFQTETVANNDTNQNNEEYVAYLFASLPGVSKVGTYTGQSNDFDVDCGFTTGARFIMVKRTDTAADWYVMDTVNGLGAGTDLFVAPNSAAQESSQDLIDSIIPSGFKVNTSGGMPLGVNGATYFFLAIS